MSHVNVIKPTRQVNTNRNTLQDFLCRPVDKNPPANAGDTDSIPVLEDSTSHGATKAPAPGLLSPPTAATEAREP